MSDKTSFAMFRTQSVWLRGGAAFVAVALACGVKFASVGQIEFQTLVLMLVAVTVSAWVGGLVSGLSATFLATFASVYFLSPFQGDASVLVNVLLFFIEGTLISLMIAALQKANLRLSQVAREEREHSHHALQQLEAQRTQELYRTLSENARDIIFGYDLDGCFTSLNSMGEKITGYRRDEVIKRNLLDLIASDYQPLAREMMMHKLAGKELPFYELEIVSKDGRRIPLEVSSWAIYENEKMIGVQGIARQISERKRTERERTRLYVEVEKAAQEWRTTFDAIESAILILDFDGRITRLNKTARTLAGNSYQTLIGTLIDDIGAEVLWSEIAAMVRYVQMARNGFSTQVRDTKREKVWEITTSPASGFANRENTFAGNQIKFDGTSRGAATNSGRERIVVIARDITSIVKLQESLRRSETMSALGSLVAGVAHEVRNPLFGVSATLDALEASLTIKDQAQRTDANYQTYIAVLRGEIERLNSLMRDLLEYGKPLNERLIIGSIEETILQAVSACAPLAEKASVMIDVCANDGHTAAKVLMERKRLAQVFQNLIENAIHHTPPKGHVTITLTEETNATDVSEWAVCEISDTGAGFKPEDLPRVFEPFFTKRRGGTGLGLSIVQRIIEEHGGSVQASNAIGGGALVVVKLPVTNDVLEMRQHFDEMMSVANVDNFA